MDQETRLRRARTFDEIAELYDRGRRAHPEQLFDELFTLAEIEPPGARVLEIGCGTGHATLSLARRGCRVTSVELGSNLARIARVKLAQFPLVQIVNAPFEEWRADGERFDIAFAANSWHWLDPTVRYARAAAALRPGGVLAFTTGGHAFPEGFDPFFTEIQECYEAIGAGLTKRPPPPPEQVPDAHEEIERSNHFAEVRIARRVWTEEFSADEYVAVMSTASDHRLMESAKRDQLFAEMRRLINRRPGGRICRHNLTILHVARRKP
jgi:SAM-dependent methyltransferase